MSSIISGQTNSNVDNVNKLGAALKQLSQFYMAGNSSDLEIDVPKYVPGNDLAGVLGNPGENIVYVKKNVGQEILRNLNSILLDTTEGAFFAKDMISHSALYERFKSLDDYSPGLGVEWDSNLGVEQFVKLVYEIDGITPAEQSLDAIAWYVTKAEPPFNTNVLESEVDQTKASISGIIKSAIELGAPGIGNYKSGFAVNSDVSNPDRFHSPTLAAFMFPNQQLSPTTRNTDAISMFCNSIPTIELSRAIPFISLKFVSAVPPILGERTKQLSLLRFLGMSIENEAGVNQNDGIGMANALPVGLASSQNLDIATAFNAASEGAGGDEVVSLSSAGMELFTSPQTMVNMDINGVVGRNPVLDPLQPLMTLESLKVEVQGLGQALLANKVGVLSFVLHDRSRMADIAPLISSDIFAGTYLIVDYGWSHPAGDDPDKNAYGALLNSMRNRSAFNIQATNFSMGQDGRARFTMKLASRGAEEAGIYPIACGEFMPAGPMRNIVETYLAKRLNEGVVSSNQEGSREIRKKINISMGAATSAGSVVPRDLYAEFQKLNAPPAKSDAQNPYQPGIAELDALMTKLIGDPNNPDDKGQISTATASLGTEVECKLQTLLETPDPFLPGENTGMNIPITVQEDIMDEKKGIKQRVSLGKILTLMVGGSLAGTGRFDEVQMMFYRFNSQAGASRDYDSIANFMIDAAVLKGVVEEYTETFPSVSVRGFLELINKNFIARATDPNYGLTTQMTLQASADEGATQAETNAISTAITDRLVQIYSDGGGKPEFTLPQIRMTFECLPAFEASSDPSKNPNFLLSTEKNILRVHVYDQRANPHQDEMFLLQCMNDSEMAVKLSSSSTSSSSNQEAAGGRVDPGDSSGAVETAEGEGLIGQITEASTGRFITYTSLVGNDVIKKIIKTTTPSITFGLANSAVQSVSVSSNTAGSVDNVLLLTAITDNPGAGEPQAKTPMLEDVMVIPANISLTVMGCPLFEYGQHFFVDMGTGTTVDNMYYVTSISHNLSPGKFETSLTLGYSGSGTIRNFRSLLEASQEKVAESASEEGASGTALLPA